MNIHEPATPSVDERRSTSWPLLVLLLVAAVTLFVIQLRRPKAPDLLVGAAMPPLSVSGWLNADTPHSAANLDGQVVLVDFWSSDCGPCVRRYPMWPSYTAVIGTKG